jgi:ketosteroid isomerase-like protein
VTAPIANLADFAALDPFFRIIEKGLDGLALPGHFFDLLAEDVAIDYVVTVPGYPRHIEGRAAVGELYRPYGTMIILDRCFDLAVHHDAAKGVVVLEYASEGHVVSTGHRYSSRYVSVLTLRDRKIAHWRDYLGPLAVFDAVGWPPRRRLARAPHGASTEQGMDVLMSAFAAAQV